MQVSQAVVTTDGPYWRVDLVVDGVSGMIPGELKGTVLMDGIAPLCGSLAWYVSATIPARPYDGRPFPETVRGMTDDPVIYTLAARHWLNVWRHTPEPGPTPIPSREEAEVAAPELRKTIRKVMRNANGW